MDFDAKPVKSSIAMKFTKNVVNFVEQMQIDVLYEKNNILEFQNHCRKYIIKNQSALDIDTILSEGSTSSFGIIFAIMLLYAADLSVFNSFNDTLDQLDSDSDEIASNRLKSHRIV